MISEGLLQPIDINVDKSPPRKRARYELRDGIIAANVTKAQEMGGFCQEEGFSRLDYDTDYMPSDDDTIFDKTDPTYVNGGCPSLTPDNRKKQAALIESVLSKETINKLSMGEWDEFIVRRRSPVPFKTDFFEKMPDEVILNVLRWLPKMDLRSISLTNRRFNRLAEDESLWTRIDVSNNCIVPGGMGIILGRQVVVLRMARCEVQHPVILPDCRAWPSDFICRLMYLDLSMACISCESLADIFIRCPRLKKLSLENVRINDAVLKALCRCRLLEVANLAMVEGIQISGLQYFLSSCTMLKELNIAWTYLSENTIAYICKNLPSSLTRLNFSGCRKFMIDGYVADLTKSCPRLTELDLSDCTKITGESLKSIASLEDLNFLSLSRCYFMTCKDILLLKALKSIQFLDIHGGYMMTNELTEIQAAMPHVGLNKYKFSSIARPTVGSRRSSIWSLKSSD